MSNSVELLSSGQQPAILCEALISSSLIHHPTTLIISSQNSRKPSILTQDASRQLKTFSQKKSCRNYHPMENYIPKCRKPMKIAQRLSALVDTDIGLQRIMTLIIKILEKYGQMLNEQNNVKFHSLGIWIMENDKIEITMGTQDESRNLRRKTQRSRACLETELGKNIMNFMLSVGERRYCDLYRYYLRSLVKYPQCDFKRLSSLIKCYSSCLSIALCQGEAKCETKRGNVRVHCQKTVSLEKNITEKNMSLKIIIDDKLPKSKKSIIKCKTNTKIIAPNVKQDPPSFINRIHPPSFRSNIHYPQQTALKKQYLQNDKIPINSSKSFKKLIGPYQKKSAIPSTKESLATFIGSRASTKRSSAYLDQNVLNQGQESRESHIEPNHIKKNALNPLYSPAYNERLETQPLQDDQPVYYPNYPLASKDNLPTCKWAHNLQSFFREENDEIKQSVIIGKEQYCTDSKVDKLDKMVNVMCESRVQAFKDGSDFQSTAPQKCEGQPPEY